MLFFLNAQKFIATNVSCNIRFAKMNIFSILLSYIGWGSGYRKIFYATSLNFAIWIRKKLFGEVPVIAIFQAISLNLAIWIRKRLFLEFSWQIPNLIGWDRLINQFRNDFHTNSYVSRICCQKIIHSWQTAPTRIWVMLHTDEQYY